MTFDPIPSGWFRYMTLASLSQATATVHQRSDAANPTRPFTTDPTLFLTILQSTMGMNANNATVNVPFGANPLFSAMMPSYNPLNIQQVDLGRHAINSNQPGELGFRPMPFIKLENNLEGKLTGTAVHFINAGKQYDIHPGLLAAIAIHETGNGSSQAVHEKLNVAGMMGPDGLRTYESLQDSIIDMARNLKENYLNQGKDTIAKIGAKYAPVGASNDPTGLNQHWVKGVTDYFNKLV